MQFKRPRLVPDRALVNAGFACGLMFLAACGGGGETAPAEPAETPPEPSSVENALMLPAVWSTNALEGPVVDIALAGGQASLMAVAYEGRGLELFNLEAERVAEIGLFSVVDLGQGTLFDLDGAELTLFPGIDADGAFKAYLFGANLLAPAEVDLPIAPSGTPAGLCAVPGIPGTSTVLGLAYWTAEQADMLVRGGLSVEGGEFVWTERDRLRADDPISACHAAGRTFEPVTGAVNAAVRLERAETTHDVLLSVDGALSFANGSDQQPLGLRDGLSVRTPPKPVAMDGLANPRGGGYPFGLIVVAGDTGGGHQVVFVDPEPLVNAGSAAGR